MHPVDLRLHGVVFDLTGADVAVQDLVGEAEFFLIGAAAHAVFGDLLDASEIKWLNDYNELVFRTLSPRLPGDIASWLRQKTLQV